MQRCRFVSLLTLTAGLAAACADRPEGPRVPEGGPGLGAPKVPWVHKTREERTAFMAAHVAPEMKRLFVKFDADEFQDFGCPTCHGRDMDLVDFRMPNDLYPLPADNPIDEAMDLDEDTAKFMMNEVVPAMAKLMSTKAGPEGVSCFSCHPKE